jgi:hypothetical protein
MHALNINEALESKTNIPGDPFFQCNYALQEVTRFRKSSFWSSFLQVLKFFSQVFFASSAKFARTEIHFESQVCSKPSPKMTSCTSQYLLELGSVL